MALGSLLMLAIALNLSPPGHSDHLNATNATLSALECVFANGPARVPGFLLKTGSSVGPLLPGESFSYQLDLEVGGPGNGVVILSRQLVDPLPTDFLFNSLVENEVSGSTITCSAPTAGTSGLVTCNIDDPGQPFVGSVDLFGEVAADAAPGLLSNTATFTMNATFGGQPLLCTAASTWEVDVISPANVTADKTVSGEFFLGGTISYQVVLTNSGPAPQVDATGDEFVDELPTEVALDCGAATSIVSGGGTLGCTEGTNTVTWNGSIPAGGSVVLEIGATIVSGTPEVPIENQGVFFFDASGDGTNDSNGTTDDPGTAPSPDPTALVLGVAPVSEIPTAGTLGLLALALLLALAALPRLRG